MKFVNLKNNKLFVIFPFFVFFLIFLSKLPGAILPPTDYFYDYVLERSEIYSVLGLFVGLIPAGVTFWSLGIYGIPLILLYILDFVLGHPLAVASLLRHNPGVLVNELSIYIAKAFLNPTRQLIIGRILVAFITSLAPLYLLEFFRKRNNIIAAIFSIAIFSTCPFLAQQNYTLAPDPLGVAFFTSALVIILGQEQLGSRRIFIGGVFLGLAIAAKFLYVAFLPVAFLAILLSRINNSKRPFVSKIRNTLIFIIGLLFSPFLFIPFFWTCPLVLAKNIFGTLWQYYCGQLNAWRCLLLETIPSLVNLVALPFFIIGFIFSFFILNKKTAILLAVSFILFLICLGNADFFLTRYVLPLIPFLCLYAGIGLDLVVKPMRYNFKIILVVLIAGTVFVGNLINVIKDFKITHQDTNIKGCVNWIKENIAPGSNIALPSQVDYFFIPNEITLERWLNNLNNSYENIDIRLKNLFALAKTEYHNLSPENPLVGKTFGALEQQRIFVYKILLWYVKNIEKPSINYNLFLYSNALEIISSKKEEILNLFLERKIDVFISSDYSSVLSPYLVKTFDRYPGEDYYVYLNNKK